MSVTALRVPRPATLLPLGYLVIAATAYIISAAGIAWLAPELAGHYYQPRILALTHTLTLGWITMTIMGASYQIIPVALERPIWSERLARWQLAIYAVGVIGMVGHFFIGEWSGLAWGAGLVAVACGMHLLNAALSIRDLPRRHFTARLVVIALTGFAATVLFGIALAADKLWPFLPRTMFPLLHAHAHLALLGWVAPMMIGVGARVYPMFLLAREPQGWPEDAQFWGLVLGVPAIVAGLMLDLTVPVVAGALAVTIALAGHLVWLVDMVRTRKRPDLDWGLRFVLTGAAFVPPAIVMGVGLALGAFGGSRMALSYAVLVIGGWVSLTIVGMKLKIVPFLVWYRVYAPQAGRRPVPSLTDLSLRWADRVAYVLLTGGTIALAISAAVGEVAWIRASGIVLTGGALTFGAALAAPLSRLVRRSTTPTVEGRLLFLRGKRSA